MLRRVFEGDTPAGVPMCLAVCGLRAVPPPPPKPPRANAGGGGARGGAADDAAAAAAPDAGGGPLTFELELTDGTTTIIQP